MMSNITNSDNKKTWLLHSAAGAIGGLCTRMVTQPFDVIKIRFQVTLVNCKYRGIHFCYCYYFLVAS